MRSCLIAVPSFLAAAALAWPVQSDQAGREITADEYIESRCTYCHSRILSIALMQRIIREDGYEELAIFLARHHVPDAKARNAIVGYFQSIQGQ